MWGLIENSSTATVEKGYLKFPIKLDGTIRSAVTAMIPARIAPGNRAQFSGQVEASIYEQLSDEVTFSLGVTGANGAFGRVNVTVPFRALYSPGPWWRKPK